MTKLIILSGPIASGKSELVKYLKNFHPLVERRCKSKLFTLVQELFCVKPERFWEIYNSRELKELPLPEFELFMGTLYLEMSADYPTMKFEYSEKEGYVYISVRQAMIFVSEYICKPLWYSSYFGVARAESLQEGEIAIDDSAFGTADEVTPAIEKIGQENILLIRIYGRGTFEGDSRCYVPDGIVTNQHRVCNIYKEEHFHEECGIIVNDFLKGGVK